MPVRAVTGIVAVEPDAAPATVISEAGKRDAEAVIPERCKRAVKTEWAVSEHAQSET